MTDFEYVKTVKSSTDSVANSQEFDHGVIYNTNRSKSLDQLVWEPSTLKLDIQVNTQTEIHQGSDRVEQMS